MENQEIFRMADELKALKDEKKEKEAYIDTLSEKIETLDQQLSSAMLDADLDKFTHSGSTYYIKSRLFASAPAEKKEDLIKALKENGCGELVVEQVNSNTLSSFIKEQQENTGKEIPEFLTDIVNVFVKTSVGIRKS